MRRRKLLQDFAKKGKPSGEGALERERYTE